MRVIDLTNSLPYCMCDRKKRIRRDTGKCEFCTALDARNAGFPGRGTVTQEPLFYGSGGPRATRRPVQRNGTGPGEDNGICNSSSESDQEELQVGGSWGSTNTGIFPLAIQPQVPLLDYSGGFHLATWQENGVSESGLD